MQTPPSLSQFCSALKDLLVPLHDVSTQRPL